MKIRIEVIATRDRGATEVKVTEGLFTFVAIDEEARPRPVDAALHQISERPLRRSGGAFPSV